MKIPNPLKEYGKLWGKVHQWASKEKKTIREFLDGITIILHSILDVFAILIIFCLNIGIWISPYTRFSTDIIVTIAIFHTITILISMVQDRTKAIEKMLIK